MRHWILRTTAAIAAICTATQVSPAAKPAASGTPSAKSVAPVAADRKVIDARAWPRSYKVDGVEFSLNRPQLDSWEGNVLKGRTVMAVKTGETKGADGKMLPQQTYGVLWIKARTETDKDAREVVLQDIVVERSSFPTGKDKEAAWTALARKSLPTTELVASLDAVEASLAITDAMTETPEVPVNNTPPEIIVSLEPAVLVPIDGDPVWRPSGVTGVEHVLNSRAPILRYQNKLYVGRAGKWATSANLESGWVRADTVPGPVSQAMTQLVSEQKRPQTQAQGGEPAATKFPVIYVRTKPAELIVVDGEPKFEDIDGTKLSYVINTPADLFLDSGNNWYVLVSGRWFTGPSAKGPWTWVSPDKLPADFSKIPSDGPKGAVLASIAGTPEAKESLVANSVPQTATVNRKSASFTALYDGTPQFEPISGTTLASAKNSPTPIFRISADSYFALDKGVWFAANTPTGPWTVATTVPAVIYSIPASSPLHYVTYVQVYGSTAEEVYVGYTPGYYGTVASNGVVVYGTGYQCNAWVGEAYYGCPTTYGYGAAFGFTMALGWGLAFGYGWYDPWYYPYWGPWYYPGYYPGYWGGAGYAYGNVYGRWGSSVVAGTGAAWANSWTGNYGRGFRGGYYNTATGGRGYGYAGRTTNIYTGNSVAAAGGIRYNPQTGRVVAGRGGAAGNIYTGNGIAGGTSTAVNTNTGRVTQSGGVATRTGQGATAAGGFNSAGRGGDAQGAGYIHYDRDTGDISHGGAVDVNGNIYAGKDGHVYKHDDSGWHSMTGQDGAGGGPVGPRDNAAKPARPGAGGAGTASTKPMQGPGLGDGPGSNTSSLDRDRVARDRGFERDSMGGRGFDRPGASRPSFNRGNYGGGFSGRMGGMRGGFRR
jgi:hypothetical protein